MSLTHPEIRAAKPADKPHKLSDEHGLYLLVKPNGAKLGQLKYRINDQADRPGADLPPSRL